MPYKLSSSRKFDEEKSKGYDNIINHNF